MEARPRGPSGDTEQSSASKSLYIIAPAMYSGCSMGMVLVNKSLRAWRLAPSHFPTTTNSCNHLTEGDLNILDHYPPPRLPGDGSGGLRCIRDPDGTFLDARELPLHLGVRPLPQVCNKIRQPIKIWDGFLQQLALHAVPFPSHVGQRAAREVPGNESSTHRRLRGEERVRGIRGFLP
ncbi:hypothetical protein THAOC_21340 [Thalassiosira oceanica]|uniref:Uncharacterized protein n=1 Tax=Thalassiosira oceanica TaxID=159749 RepID=K0SC56_THAOC|nr:hypothetical protein THAOC_21340 [Thalassiosira oceanica]|eukprot:EJK58526.1 hypothetical protein THAOC_21340 [Thalassiosira oceanica]